MGKLFVIDGTDGSGKQTQLQKLKERLDENNIEYKVMSFPNYESPSSSLVKMYLSGEFGQDPKMVSPYIASTFYAADRYATYKKELEDNQQLLCPKCGAKLIMNRISKRKYSEEGYIQKWNLYMKWLQGTLNRNVCILELGVGMKYPSVIRWPFEKIAFINQKAKFIRVHDYLYQLTEDLKEKGISVQENPCVFLTNQIV